MTEYEIIADPKEYGIEKLVDGLKAKSLENWLAGDAAIKSTPASLKTLKIQLFKINDALDTSITMVNKLECDIVPCITEPKP